MKKIIMICLMAVIGFGVSGAMAQKKQVELKTTVFQTDVDCENCAKKVDNSIPYQKGVKEVKVDVSTQTVTVTMDGLTLAATAGGNIVANDKCHFSGTR